MRLIWQAILTSCLLRFGLASVQTDVEEPICTDFMCTRHSLKTETRTFIDDLESGSEKQIECTNCELCATSGYSVCLKTKESDDKCMCAQEVPRGCSILSRTSPKPVPEQQQMNICYSSSLRNPPKPIVTDEPNEDLVVTIDQFWLKNYWKNMKLENLTIYYEFPTSTARLCDGVLSTVKRSNGEGIGYMCTAMLKIELEEEPIDSKDNSESISHDEYSDNNLPPEIQFERAVFADAPFVRFYFKINVRRDRQLSSDNKLVEKLTTLTSDLLTYDLDPSSPKSTTTQAKSEPKVENDHGKEVSKNNSFLNKHLNNGGQLQLIICVGVITLGVCLLVIVITFLWRRHSGNAKRSTTKVPVTKMNGYEYRATVQDEK